MMLLSCFYTGYILASIDQLTLSRITSAVVNSTGTFTDVRLSLAPIGS